LFYLSKKKKNKYFLSKDINNELRDKQTNLDLLQQNADDLSSKSTAELNYQLKSDLKLLKQDYQNLTDSVNERLNKLERFINDLKKLDEDFNRMQNGLNKVEAQLQIEHHSSVTHGLSHGKSIEVQLDHLKQVKYDLDSMQSSMFKLNEQAEKYFYLSNTDSQFISKLKIDLNNLNDKFTQLKTIYSKKYTSLEDAYKKSTKVDNEIDDLDHWITLKEYETPDDDGIILNEEQFEQKIVKYKQLKTDIDRREPEVKRILETGNDMLKNSSGGVSNVADLARSMININTKWSNLNKKVDSKNKLFTQLNDYVNELRRKFIYCLFFF
jgi:chromosome segregation ATPase